MAVTARDAELHGMAAFLGLIDILPVIMSTTSAVKPLIARARREDRGLSRLADVAGDQPAG